MEKPLEVSWSEGLALQGAVWIDVREPNEVTADPGPTNVEWVRLPLSQFQGEAPEGVLVVACAHGMRSARVASQLRASGRIEVYSLSGGIAGLRATEG